MRKTNSKSFFFLSPNLFLYFHFVHKIQNQQIYDSIISGDWFLLPRSEQMMYKFLMCNIQESKALTIGGLSPLNMVSCVSVVILHFLNFYSLSLKRNIFFLTFL